MQQLICHPRTYTTIPELDQPPSHLRSCAIAKRVMQRLHPLCSRFAVRSYCSCSCWSQRLADRNHRSHFGSRYKWGCCGYAGLFLQARAQFCISSMCFVHFCVAQVDFVGDFSTLYNSLHPSFTEHGGAPGLYVGRRRMRVRSVIQRATFLAFSYIVATSNEDWRRLCASL